MCHLPYRMPPRSHTDEDQGPPHLVIKMDHNRSIFSSFNAIAFAGLVLSDIDMFNSGTHHSINVLGMTHRATEISAYYAVTYPSRYRCLLSLHGRISSKHAT